MQNTTDIETLEFLDELELKYPAVPLRRYVGTAATGVAAAIPNPKVANLYQGFTDATHDLIWIADAGIETTADALSTLVAEHEANGTSEVSVVHQLPVLARVDTFSDIVEQMYFGTVHAKQYFFFDFIGENCVNGMSTLLRRSTLNQVGGLVPYGKFIAEDFYLTQALYDRGFRSRLSLLPARQRCTPREFEVTISRFIRWAQLRRYTDLAHSIGAWFEFTNDVIPTAALGAFGLSRCFPIAYPGSVPFVMGHTILWYICDIAVLQGVHEQGMLPPLALSSLAWIVREVLSVWVYIRSRLSNNIEWKGRVFKLRIGGVGDPIATDKD